MCQYISGVALAVVGGTLHCQQKELEHKEKQS